MTKSISRVIFIWLTGYFRLVFVRTGCGALRIVFLLTFLLLFLKSLHSRPNFGLHKLFLTIKSLQTGLNFGLKCKEWWCSCATKKGKKKSQGISFWGALFLITGHHLYIKKWLNQFPELYMTLVRQKKKKSQCNFFLVRSARVCAFFVLFRTP